MKVPLLPLFFAFTSALHAETGSYHTTGPVVNSDQTSVTIQKGTAQWTFERGPELAGPLPIGTTVTINYHMVADSAVTVEPKHTPPVAPKTTGTAAKPKTDSKPAAKKLAPKKPSKPKAQ